MSHFTLLLGLFQIIKLSNIVQEPELRLLDFYEIPSHLTVGDTRVGGLSGIDYDSGSGLYYVVSDDRSEIGSARFYTLKIQLREENIDTVIFEAQTLFKEVDKEYFEEQYSDFESIRFHPYQQLIYIGNEGGKKGKPGILIFDLEGNWVDEIDFSDEILENIRPNKAFEALSFDARYENFFFALEGPLINSPAISFETETTLNIEERAVKGHNLIDKREYRLSPIPQHAESVPPWGGLGTDNGVSEILAINKNEIIIIERSGAYQKDGSFSYISRVFYIRFYQGMHTKHLLYDFNKLGRSWNIEGVCLGPVIDGKQTLIFVSDNNFSTQKTGLFLFSFQ